MRRVAKEAPTKISDLFEVYKKRLKAPEKSVIHEVCEVLQDLLNLSLDAKSFSYSPHTRILTVKASGMIKTEIILKKDEILTHLKGRLGTQNAPTTII
jgi:hypothetical protein